MKYLSLITIVLLNTFLNASEPFVQIYQTHDNGLYGRSEDRDLLLTVNESVFKRFNTLKVESEYNFLTGVVLSTTTVNNLESMMNGLDKKQVGFIRILKDGKIYTIEDDNLFLQFSFSYEKPTEEVLNIITEHYKDLPDVRDEVLEHYKNNYVIRIHSAENILMPEAREITYDEALIMATIIGDKEQWLWGVHDGRDYLKDLLF